MRIHFSNGSHMPRKTQLLTTTAMSLAIAVGFAVLHPSAGSAQEILTFRDGDAQTPGTWDDNDNDFLDADNNVEDFDDGDFVNFGSASTLIQITRDLRPGSITFDTGGGTSVLSTAQSEGNLSINDSRDFEVNPGDTLDFNVVNGTLELRVDVVTTDGTSNSTIRVNADGTSTGELAVIEDFFGDVEVFDGTLSLNSGLNEEGVARDASVRGVLRVENGVVNNNADVFGITRVGANRAAGDVDPRTATLNHGPDATLRGGETRVREDGILNANGGTFTDEDGNIDPNAEVNIERTGIVNINEDTAVNVENRSGTLNIGGVAASDPDAELNGDVQTRAGSTTNIDGTLDGEGDFTGGTVNVNGTVTGDVELRDLDDGGAITPGTAIVNANTGATFDNEVIVRAGELNANGADFDGGIRALGGDIDITVTQVLPLENEGSNIDVEAGVTLGGAYTNTSGTLNVAATATVTEEVALDGGTVNADGGAFTNGFDLDDGRLNVNGTLTSALTNDASTDIVITNGGTLNATVTNSGADATLTVETGGDAAQLVTLNGGTLTADGGTFTGGLDLNDGTLEVTDTLADALTNNASTIINVQTDGALTGAVTNSGDGAIINNLTGGAINGEVTLSADGVLNAEGGTFGAGGVVLNGGTLNINADTALTVLNEGAQVNINETLMNGVTNNSGTLTNNGEIDGSVSIVDGRFEQESGNVVGPVTLTDGRLVADGGTFDGDLDATGGSIGVTGAFEVVGPFNADGSGVAIATAGNLTTSTLTFDNETLSIRGTLTGDLAFSGGTGEISGNVTEEITQEDGRLTVIDGATVSGETTVNDGTLIARGGEFESDVLVQTGGRAIVTDSSTQSGDVTAVVRNQGGGVFIREDGNLIGTLENETGNTSMRGAISGDLNVSGGVVTARDSASVTMDTNVSDAGTLSVVNGTFEERIRVTGSGTLEARGNLIGNIENAGGSLILGDDIAGTVTNEDGSATSDAIVDGSLMVAGGDFTQTGGDILQQSTVDGGDLIASGGAFTGGISALDGTVTVDGAVGTTQLDVAGADVAIVSGGVLSGDVDFASGLLDLDGEIDGTLDISSASTSAPGVTTTASATVTQQTTLTSGRIDANGGDFEGGISNDGGRVVVGGAVTGAIDNNDGTFVLRSVATLNGNVTNADRVLQNGDITGNVSNNGDYTANGSTTGAVTNNAEGEFTVASDATITGGLTNDDAATVNLESTLTSDLLNEEGGTVNFDNATLNGELTNFGDVFSDGNSFVTGDSVNEGTITVNSGSLMFEGMFENNSPNTLNIADGATFEADGLINGPDGRIVNAGTLLGEITNNGVIESDGGVFGGVLTNTNDITVEGTSGVAFDGGLRNNGLVDLTGDGGTGNTLTVGGEGLSGDGRYQLDIDLAAEAGGLGQSDYIIAEAGAAVTGNLAFSFNILGEGGQQIDDIPILIVDGGAANDFTFTPNNVTDPGDAVIYSILRDSDGGLVVADLVNPGVGALAGSVVLSQSLIGAVINRPSSPFVNGLAYDDENPCGAGGWARAIGGTADASGRIDQTGDTQNVSFESEISADYYGIQVGGDYACFNGYYNGWDIATGGIAGVNQGSSSQPIFAFDPNTLGSSTDTIIATTDVDFNQVYAGVYGTAVRDRFAAELQYRFEATDFTANNDASGSLQLTDAEFGSDSNTFSGSFSYALSVPNTELTFVPVTGFAYTQISPDEITFDDGGVVTIEDFTSEVLFVGGTLSRTKFGDDGTTALNQFVTATYYNEMADDPVSNYVTADGLNRSEVTTENLGAYTELSVGMNYVKILDEGNSFNAKQLSASARADVRMSDQLESWGLTAQVRL